MKNHVLKIVFSLCFFPVFMMAGITTITNSDTQAITDNSCFNKTFNMLTSESINDINIEVNIDHTWRADLDITLTSPQGTAVDLTSDNGGGSNNLYVLFDDAAATSITADNSNHTSTVTRKPEVALSAFNGEDAQGVWVLEVCDDAGADTGTFHYSTLEIDSTAISLSNDLQVDYRMDECYWLDGAGGVFGDVKDTSIPYYDATSAAASSIDSGVKQMCRSGKFGLNGDRVSVDDASVLGTLTNQLTISAWLYPTAFTQWSSAVQKVSNDSWNDGFGLIHNSGDGTNITFYINNAFSGAGRVSASLTMNTWNHIVGVYDGTSVTIYKNGVFVETSLYSTPISNSSQPLTIGNDFLSDSYNDVWQGNIDEVKVWDKALSETEISTIYTNELAGKNFDGAPRVCPTCEANATAGIWGLIGIPADLRTSPNKDVADVFDEFPAGSYNVPGNADGWVVKKRDYSTTNNASSYSTVPYNGMPLEFGQGYWLLTKQDVAWGENGLHSVDYNATHAACVTESCVEIDLTSVVKNFGAPDNDVNDHSGRNRNNMLGFIGHTPVNWADCRILINGTSYTPSAADSAGYIDKQIWQYNPGAGGANANGYTTCDDTTPGGCKLEPYKGFWVVLHGITKNKTVKLLIPKE